MKPKMKLKPWHDTLIESLKNPMDAAEYLNVVLAEGDPRMFLVALRNVAEAQGGLRKIARETKLNRANLHKMLSREGNPEVYTLTILLQSMGLRLSVSVDQMKRAA